MNTDDLKHILEQHKLWLEGNGGSRANLTCANLTCANLIDADLINANLRGANLIDADLTRANLIGANLIDANLRGANLIDADLTRANLIGANLIDANLRGANLCGADLPDYSHCPEEGAFIAFKKLLGGVVAKIEVPADAKRTSSLVGRKCRAEFVKVLKLSGGEVGLSKHDGKTEYRVGEIVRPDSYDDDPRVECTSGIHFFITRKEAEQY